MRYRPLVAGGVAAVALAAYLNGHLQHATDSVPTSLVAVTLLSEGTFRLDRFTEALTETWGAEPYFLVRTPRGVMSIYPVATGLLAAPVLVPALLTVPATTPKELIAAAHRSERYAAALITAASIVVFALLCWQLGFSDRLAVGLTIFYAFGSQAFSTSSQLLWQHGPGTLFILVSFLCFARLRVRATHAAAVCFALAWAIAVAIRPMNVVMVGPLVALALFRFPRVAVYALLPAVLVGLPVITYNQHFFGTLGGGYATQPLAFALTNLSSGLPSLLLSPGRGLFLYFPVAAVALVMAARRRVLHDDVGRAALAAVILIVLLFASYEHWHGGVSVGPRYLTEAEALLLVLFGVAWQTLPQQRKTPLAVLCFGVLLPYSVFIQVVGTYSAAPSQWNYERASEGVAALWDFRDNPIAHAFRQRPPR